MASQGKGKGGPSRGGGGAVTEAEEIRIMKDYNYNDVTLTNCLDLFRVATARNYKKARAESVQFISQHLAALPGFVHFTLLQVREFLDLICGKASQSTKFKTILKWVNHAPDERKVYFQTLLDEHVNIEQLQAALYPDPATEGVTDSAQGRGIGERSVENPPEVAGYSGGVVQASSRNKQRSLPAGKSSRSTNSSERKRPGRPPKVQPSQSLGERKRKVPAAGTRQDDLASSVNGAPARKLPKRNKPRKPWQMSDQVDRPSPSSSASQKSAGGRTHKSTTSTRGRGSGRVYTSAPISGLISVPSDFSDSDTDSAVSAVTTIVLGSAPAPPPDYKLLYPVVKQKKTFLFSYDFENATAKRLYKIRKPRQLSSLIATKTHVYNLGGAFSARVGAKSSSTVEEFRLGKEHGEYGPMLLESRKEFGACIFKNSIYAVGGCQGNASTNCVEALPLPPITRAGHPGPLEWIEMEYLKESRGAFDVAVLGDHIYAVGGIGAKPKHCTSELKSVEVYDAVKNMWSYVAEMKTGRGYPAS